MGVPGFFGWLLRNYNSVLIQKTPDNDVDTLYIDANCLIHPQCFHILDHTQERNVPKLEEMMIKRIIYYIKYIIDFVKPQETFIAVDGVAPLAKISQQRKRRFKSIKDNAIKNNIKQKYNIPFNDSWSNSSITPGTLFMEKLHIQLVKTFVEQKDRRIIYSSYHTAGEGEHKILDEIKIRKLGNKIQANKSNVIYGLDADLIFLSLVSGLNNVYLLREKDQISNNHQEEGITNQLVYVSIDKTKRCYVEQLNMISGPFGIQFDATKVIDDFVFICYLLGNDFLPAPPSVDVRKYGLDMIIDSYIQTFNFRRLYIIDKNQNGNIRFNNQFIYDFFDNLGHKETEYFTNILSEFKQKDLFKTCRSYNQWEKDLWEFENLKNVKIYDPIKFGVGDEDGWKLRYYKHYFERESNNIDDLCYHFIAGLKWTTLYYYNGCQQWDWYYPYIQVPFVSDLAIYMRKKKIDFNAIEFNNNSVALKPFEQLLAVLPPQCSYLLPRTYQYLMTSVKSPIIDLYPIEFSIDMIGKDMAFQCVPYLPNINIERIKKASSNIFVEKSEVDRNKTETAYKSCLFIK